MAWAVPLYGQGRNPDDAMDVMLAWPVDILHPRYPYERKNESAASNDNGDCIYNHTTIKMGRNRLEEDSPCICLHLLALWYSLFKSA